MSRAWRDARFHDRRDRRRSLWIGIAVVIVAGLAVAACSGGASGNTTPPPPTDDPPTTVTDTPAPDRTEPEVPGVIVAIPLEDIPGEGFESVPFINDVPGYLRELDDAVLSEIGRRASNPDLAGGQGFVNRETGEVIFVITIALQGAQRALDTIDYIDIQPVEDVLNFISPDETLFESEQRLAPEIGDASLRYFLRYGVEENGERVRDVTTDLVIFSQGGSLVFIQRSVVTPDEPLAEGLKLDVAALSETISIRFAEAITASADGGK